MKEKVWSCSEYDEAQPKSVKTDNNMPEHQIVLA
tara:strand:- start:1031 stop:1132 length:102 start_codon:yes stop_codon:yes gene_type:complete